MTSPISKQTFYTCSGCNYAHTDETLVRNHVGLANLFATLCPGCGMILCIPDQLAGPTNHFLYCQKAGNWLAAKGNSGVTNDALLAIKSEAVIAKCGIDGNSQEVAVLSTTHSVDVSTGSAWDETVFPTTMSHETLIIEGVTTATPTSTPQRRIPTPTHAELEANTFAMVDFNRMVQKMERRKGKQRQTMSLTTTHLPSTGIYSEGGKCDPAFSQSSLADAVSQTGRDNAAWRAEWGIRLPQGSAPTGLAKARDQSGERPALEAWMEEEF